jgi:heat shock protein HslJ
MSVSRYPVLRYAVPLLAIAAIAWPVTPPQAHPGLAGSQWHVVEISGARTPGAGTLRFTHTSVRGKGSCNAFFGAFREHGDRIEIAGLFPADGSVLKSKPHVMPCNGHWSVERLLLESLRRAASYRIDRGILVLIDADGRPLARLST